MQVRLHVLLLVVAFLFIVVYTLFINSNPFTYDEPYYLSNVQLLQRYGLGPEFLVNLKGPAGPLYAVVHWSLSPITNLSIKATRSINILFLIGIIVSLFYLLRIYAVEHSGAKSLLVLAIPMVYVCIGMALTEVPAMFFFCIAMLTLTQTWRQQSYLMACVSGTFMSLAILGRQPYLIVLGAVPILLIGSFNFRSILLTVLFLTCSLVLPIYVFSLWGGLVPHTGGDVAIRGSFAPFNLFISLGYAFLITLFVCPCWLGLPKKKYAVLYSSSFFIILFICYVFDFEFNVMASVTQKLFPFPLFQMLYSHFMAAVLIFVGLFFVYCSLKKAFESRSNKFRLFFIASCILVVITSLKVTHQFSSRYVFQAAPLFILMFSDHIGFDKKTFVLRMAAIGIGIASLLSYFSDGI